MKNCCIFAIPVLFLTVEVALSQDSFQETLLSHEKEMINAIVQKDRVKLTEMLSAETFAVTQGGGRQTGEEMRRSLDHITMTNYGLREVKAIKVSPDVGILTYKFNWSGTNAGVQLPATTVWATSTWAMQDGEWKSIFYQETPLSKRESEK